MASTSYLPADFGIELARLQPTLQLVETEDTWQKIEKAIAKLDAITKGGAYKGEAYVPLLKEHASSAIVHALLSERTRLSGTAADFVMSAAPRLAARFEGLVSTFVPPLLLCCTRTNKVALARAKKCLLLIARHCRLPSLVPLLREAAHNKAITLRLVALETLVTLLQTWQAQGGETLERHILTRAGDVEDSIRASATDRDPEVRHLSKTTFEIYSAMWPERVESFTTPLTPTSRRYLCLSSSRPQHNASMVDKAGQNATVASRPPSRLQVPRRPLAQTQPSQAKAESAKSSPAAEVKRDGVYTPALRTPSSAVAKKAHTVPARAAQKAETAKSQQRDEKQAATTHKTFASSNNNSCPERGKTSPRENCLRRSASPAELPVEKENLLQRAALQSEVERLSSSTPSRSIAARLALEQFDRRTRQHASSGITASRREATGSNRAALTAFAIAVAKKQSPRRMPARIPLVSQSSSAAPATAIEVEKPAPAVAALRETIQPDEESKPTLAKSGEDVFQSRPLDMASGDLPPSNITSTSHHTVSTSPFSQSSPAAATKKTSSSLSRKLTARDQLLGASRRSPAGGRAMQHRTAVLQRRAAAEKYLAAGGARDTTHDLDVASDVVASSCSLSTSPPPFPAPRETPTPAPQLIERMAPEHETSGMSIARSTPLPSSPMMLGVRSPLSHPSMTAAAALARSPPSVMLRQMALSMLGSDVNSSPAARREALGATHPCTFSSPLRMQASLSLASSTRGKLPSLPRAPLQGCRKI